MTNTPSDWKWFHPLRFPHLQVFRLLVFLACFVTIVFQSAPAGAQDVVVESDLLRVEAPAGHERYADSVMSYAVAAMRELSAKTGDALKVPVTFVVSPDRNDFLSKAGGEGEHALAVAIGSRQLVIINMAAMRQSGADKIQEVLVHELAHVYLDVRCRNFVPRWVHEGVAQMIAGEWPDAPGPSRLAIAAYTGSLIPLENLVDGFPGDLAGRDQAYAQALSVTKYLVAEDHGGSLRHFLNSIRGDEGRIYLGSLGNSLTLRELQSRWRDDLRSPLSLMTIFLGSSIFWGFGALLLLVAYVIKRKRGKAIRQQWDEEEPVWSDYDGLDVDDPDDVYIESDGDDWKRSDY